SFDAESADLEISAGQQHLTATDKKETQMEAQDWITLSQQICFPVRKASGSRSTAETDISIALNLDGTGQSNIDTGIRFLDHMLDQISKHGLIDLDLQCNGDLEVDEHHTIEEDRKSTRLNSSHVSISYAVFCLKKKKQKKC